MNVGKVPQQLLEKQISHLKYTKQEIVLRPSIGEDCAALKLNNDETFVVSTDPITGAIENIGSLAVHININDLASSGADPIGVMTTILLPKGTKEEELKKIFDELKKATEDIGVDIIGGHTEVTEAVNKPIISVTAIGKVKDHQLVKTSGAEAGQDVVMTKWSGIEGTAIIACDHQEYLSNYLSDKELKEAKGLGNFLSVLEESRIAKEYDVTSMHDATEGGILGAAYELAECSNVGIEIEVCKISVKEVTKKICSIMGINHLGLISSGVMLMTTHKGKELVTSLENEGIHAKVIGKITTDGNKKILDNGVSSPLVEPKEDELYHINRQGGNI